MSVIEHYKAILNSIVSAAASVGSQVELVAVSKTYDVSHIRPVLEAGHRIFGENRVQEAKLKWPDLRQRYPGLELHLIGPLQSNKAAEAVGLFDVIQTVDRPKIAEVLAAEMRRQNRHLRLFVQVNTGLEPQKAGVAPKDCSAFVGHLRTHLGLKVDGLMCIPPANELPGTHFKMLAELGRANGLDKLSMGMSGDYLEAISAGATHVRVGSAIFGART